MSFMSAGSLNPEPLSRLVKNGRMVNRVLASICGQENLSKIGVKAELQNRIIERLYQHAANNDVRKFDRLKAMIENPAVIPPSGQYSHTAALSSYSDSAKNPVNTSATSIVHPIHGGIRSGNINNVLHGTNHFHTPGNQVILLKPSPYYSVVEQIGPTVIFEVMAAHHYTAKISISVNQYPILRRLTQEADLRVMVFGVSEGHGVQDVAFPHQSELKINGGEIKANLRGLRNRPGSTKPVDITDAIRFNPPSYVNNIEMTYALTTKKYYLFIYVTRNIPISTLVQAIRNGQKITEKSVMADMVHRARDSEIIATASVLSLKCPLSTKRIDLPCRSIACRHTQCFDATSYLQLQEQGPTWSCPICSNPAPFESLAVDEYVKNILQKTSKSTEQVTIQADGKWELFDQIDALNGTPNGLDDEIVEITQPGRTRCSRSSGNLETPLQVSHSTSIGSKREISSVQSTSEVTSMKRPRATVIDLTSSGDEEQENSSARPQKRICVSPGHSKPLNLPIYHLASSNEAVHRH